MFKINSYKNYGRLKIKTYMLKNVYITEDFKKENTEKLMAINAPNLNAGKIK